MIENDDRGIRVYSSTFHETLIFVKVVIVFHAILTHTHTHIHMYAHAHLSSSVIMTSWPLCDPGMLMLSPIKTSSRGDEKK